MSLYYGDSANVETVGSVDVGEQWEFNILLVLKDKSTGKLYYGTDAGCSCPVPFEGYESAADLQEITNANAFAQFARNWVSGHSYSDREAVESIIRSVRRRMARKGSSGVMNGFTVSA
jgi:hypothetical protein